MSIPNELEKDIEKVSIITPCYNASKYIGETYQYIATQTYNNWEWIIIDDDSKDDSYKIISELAKEDERIKVFKNDVNSGAAITRNNCLKKSTGGFIAFLDSDDVWKPEKLKKQIQFMQDSKCTFSYHNYELIDARGEFIKNQLLPDEVSASDLLKCNPFATSSIVISSEHLKENNIWFKEHLRRRQDYLFWFDNIRSGKSAKGMKDILSGYRLIGGDSLSANKKKMAIIQWKLYRDEFKLSFVPRMYYFLHYAVHGIKKYFLK